MHRPEDSQRYTHVRIGIRGRAEVNAPTICQPDRPALALASHVANGVDDYANVLAHALDIASRMDNVLCPACERIMRLALGEDKRDWTHVKVNISGTALANTPFLCGPDDRDWRYVLTRNDANDYQRVMAQNTDTTLCPDCRYQMEVALHG